MIYLESTSANVTAERYVSAALNTAGIKSSIVQQANDPTKVIQVEYIPSSEETRQYRKQLAEKNQELEDLEANLQAALDSIKTFHSQQNELYTEFVSLRDKYDTQKKKMRSLLWTFLPDNVNGFENLPKIDGSVDESVDRIGRWKMGKTLGEGQFAVVREILSGPDSLMKSRKPSQIAAKRINKDRVTDVKNARRVNNEIGILRDLKHPNIVGLVDIAHTEKYVYIIQERGGQDLFEYYRKHSGPATDEFAISVMTQLAAAVEYLSKSNIVHRDIKPENILIGENNVVKLVDFGLSSNHNSRMTIDDFCGTPGFFAPEMLTDSIYDSAKLDVWSTGCVFLEMVLGHCRFAEVWMPAYAYDLLHDSSLFERELTNCLQAVDIIFSKSGDTEEQKHSEPADTLHEQQKLISRISHKKKAAVLKACKEQRKRPQGIRDILRKMIARSPKNRACPQEVSGHGFLKAPKKDTWVQPKGYQGNKTAIPPKFKNTRTGSSPVIKVSEPSTSGLLGRRLDSTKKNLSVCTALPGSGKSQSRIQFPPLSPASPNIAGAQEIVRIGDELMDKHELEATRPIIANIIH
mmetsp:Transcript_5529/g.12343  ORF Transcript_5529/g.12343 Transcript_5529/m.12343 type:complete len:577 (-) Transcript_5529:3012-4742(-)